MALAQGTGVTTGVRQQYLTPTLPSGCIFKIQLTSTWGDQHYIGLNGLELYDEFDQLVELDDTHIQAFPRDINVLRGDRCVGAPRLACLAAV